jgi:two-component system cell cycle sensor histidine kinase/response regulator CckA
LMNLAVNARDAMPVGGRLTIETGNVVLDEDYCLKHADATPQPTVMLAVSDTGIGMDEATRSRVFEPFFTTKPPGAGTGLGLSTVYGIVRQSGGSVTVYSEPGRGTTFKVYLPRVSAKGHPVPQPSVLRSAVGGHETVLVVEDEKALRELTAQVLAGVGYRVYAAGSADEALALVAGEYIEIDVLLTDVVLPGAMQGNDLGEMLAARLPGLPVLYMSGYTRNAILHAGRRNFLEKPFTPTGLTQALRRVIDESRH